MNKILKYQAGRKLHYLSLLPVLVICTAAVAQVTSLGAIQGTVTDSSGAMVPGASVQVVNQATRLTRTLTTSDRGVYVADALPGGDYTVTVSRPGFKQGVVQNIHLDPGQRRGVDVSLAVGDVNTQITVEANTVQVQTESSESGGTISAKEVSNLMLNGRNFQTLAQIVPGVSAVTGGGSLPQYGFGGYLGQTAVIVGGSSVEKSAYTIDGVYDADPSGLLNVNVVPELDAIAEFRILKSSYSARYGMAGSGQILVETKSGGNTFHGTGYEYLRNNQFATARPFISTTGNTPLHYNIFGYALGGPLMIPGVYNSDRSKNSYFFAAGEWRVNHHYDGTHTRSMFYQAMRNGDFSQSPTMPAKGLVLDANSQALLTSQGLNPATCITNGPDGRPDQIAASCMDPTAVALMKAYWPLPNATNPANLAAVNYTNTGTDSDTQNDQTYRIDQGIGKRNIVTGRWMSEEVLDLRPRNYNDPAPIPTSKVYSRGLNAMLRVQTNVSANVINTAQIAETYSKWLLGVSDYTLPAGASIAQRFSGADPLGRIPDISLSGIWAWLGVGAQPNYNHTGEGIASDDMSWVKNNHVLQFGALYIFGIRRANANAFPMGNFSFTGIHTGDPAADYLLGLNTSYTQSSVQRSGVFHNRWAEAYFQDDWKALPRLTLNLGLRWTFLAPTTMSGAQVTNFNPATFNPAEAPVISTTGHETLNANNQPLTASGAVANPTNGLVFSGQSGTPYGFISSKNYWGPRIGFAYQLTDDGKTSVFGGYGLGYTPVAYEQIANLISNPPYVQSTTINNSLLSKPTIGVVGAPPIPSLSVIGLQTRAVATSTYSLTVEREVAPHAVASVAYAGSVTRHITLGGYDYNFPVNGSTSTTPSCAASASNPANGAYGTYAGPPVTHYSFDPCLNTGVVSSLYYRPYAGYSSMSGSFSGGSGNYNSLQTGLVYRLTDLQLNLAYTWSKSLTNVIPGNPGANGAGVGYDEAASPQNPRNLAADYGLPDFDRTHVFTSAWVYQMPFFRHSGNLFARELLSGWGTSGLAVLESGFAITPSLGTAGTGLATRPNLVGKITHPGSGKPFDPKPYVSPAAFQPPAYGLFGDSSPGTIRGPKDITFNVAADKTFPLTERVNFKLRAEAFNVFNHPNTVVTTVWSGTNGGSFGTVNGAGDQRIMEFSGRFTF
ncbi:TonB-dependent receptor [Pseudacidobacterium ailaaui]|uniref:TonB-dependent receptor n=1 Tax=Pseudacidobacterium ailaaui TaxID=1382359 RepID=UPI00138DEEFE|nr:carboxypeptidase regulatory-like domain-containing protein [Pseudacidobacterium ailaaui]